MRRGEKKIPKQYEIPEIQVYRNDEGDVCIAQDADTANICEGSLIELDDSRAILLAMALIDTVKGE